jgi:hypothetical protein
MKSLKFIVSLSLLVLVALFAVAASTHAQQCPGYNPTMTQGGWPRLNPDAPRASVITS